MVEITGANLQFSLMNIDHCPFDRMQAESIYRVLLALGATKRMHFMFDEGSGSISIIEDFEYPFDDLMLPEKKTRTGQQCYPLMKYIRKLVRFDRAAHKRMENVEKKINAMHRIVDAAAKQMKA